MLSDKELCQYFCFYWKPGPCGQNLFHKSFLPSQRDGLVDKSPSQLSPVFLIGNSIMLYFPGKVPSVPPVSLCNWHQKICGDCFHAAKFQQSSLPQALSTGEADKQWEKIRAAVSTLPAHRANSFTE